MPRKPKNQRKEFTGDLKKPIMLPEHDYSTFLYELEDGEFEKKQAEYQAQYKNAVRKIIRDEETRKLELLTKHYGIPEGPASWEILALELARDFVPGFQLEQQKSRQYAGEFWNPMLLLKLYIDFEKEMSHLPKHIRTQGKAAEKISKNENWVRISQSEHGFSAKTIQNKISEAKSNPMVLFYIECLENNDQKQVSFLEEMAEEAFNSSK